MSIRSVEAIHEITLDEPREFIYSPTGERAAGVYVQWRSYFSPGAGWDHIGAVLFAKDGRNADAARATADAPNWCPVPPEGWDDKVREFRAQHEAAARQ